ncbi:hypothetical protein L0337_14140 [candidate division KSB1 bacterium]|nr:hypothetical protein [candidate division KSB1 bacterium]
MTQNGAVLGTPSYMSPEQIRGDKVDGLPDIFSPGVIVYEMAAGNRPFLGESLATISNRILSQMPYGRSRFWLLISIRKYHWHWMPCWCRPWPKIKRKDLPPTRPLPRRC